MICPWIHGDKHYLYSVQDIGQHLQMPWLNEIRGGGRGRVMRAIDHGQRVNIFLGLFSELGRRGRNTWDTRYEAKASGVTRCAERLTRTKTLDAVVIHDAKTQLLLPHRPWFIHI